MMGALHRYSPGGALVIRQSRFIFNNSSTHSNRHGFTLVELLIVVAIITILAATLLAAFGRARESGRRTVCISNMMQIGLGLKQYVDDNSGYMPIRYLVIHPGQSDPPGNAFGHQKPNNWRVQLFPYVRNINVFRCPSNPEGNTSATIHPKHKHWVIPGQTIDINVSYACNYSSSGLGVFGSAEDMQTVHRREIPHPASTISVAESTSTDPEINIDDRDMVGQLFAGHSGASNYLFVDGHVKALRPLQTYYSGKEIENMWYRDHSPFKS